MALQETLARWWEACLGTLDKLIVFGNREPILTGRRVLWLVTTGWLLGVLYLVASLVVLSTVAFAPFALQVLQIAMFALDGGITLEPYTPSPSQRGGFWGFYRNPRHPYTIAANVAWAVLLGWALVMFHAAAALVQALTIVGLSTALTQLELASYVIWPFGREVRRKPLPTTLADLHLSRMPPAPSSENSREEAWV